MTIELTKVKAELDEWRYLIGDDIADAIVSNLEEEADEDEPQTECDDRYAVRNDSDEVVAYACPLGCEQPDCQWR